MVQTVLNFTHPIKNKDNCKKFDLYKRLIINRYNNFIIIKVLIILFLQVILTISFAKLQFLIFCL